MADYLFSEGFNKPNVEKFQNQLDQKIKNAIVDVFIKEQDI